MKMDNVRISGKLGNGPNLLASVVVSFETVDFGWVTIKGFRIWKSTKFNRRLQEEVNITPPASCYFGRWIEIIFFEKVDKWALLEEKIYAWFNQERSRDCSDAERIANEVFLGLNNNNNQS